MTQTVRTTSNNGTLGQDLGAGLVVFLVALPLCLGIALASGATALAGLVTGVVGGVIVAWLSGSPLSVSGPAAGLTVVVFQGIAQLGYPAFLTAVVIAGLIQLALGYAKAGIFGYFIPATVIRGMLAGIGTILIIKQIPHAIGFVPDSPSTHHWGIPAGHPMWGSVIVGAIGLLTLISYEKLPKKLKLPWLPGPLLVVFIGVGISQLFVAFAPTLMIPETQFVNIPALQSIRAQLSFPDFAAIRSAGTWTTALTIATIASIETLLCVEAIDKLDPLRRNTPTNRELKAQGVGNMISGLLGGIPMTAVVVRGSANIEAGGKTRMAAFVHGLLLLVAVLALGRVINLIPNAALAAVLLHIGYKLCPVSLFRSMYKKQISESLPFVITYIGVVVLDLLKGVALGLVMAVFFILRRSYEVAYKVEQKDDGSTVIRLGEQMSFLHKASLAKAIESVPSASPLTIDGSATQSFDPDVVELIRDLEVSAKASGRKAILVGVPESIGGGAH